jgi:hypothetical protein
LAPRLTELIRLEGKIDYDGPSDTPVRGLVFRSQPKVVLASAAKNHTEPNSQ